MANSRRVFIRTLLNVHDGTILKIIITHFAKSSRILIEAAINKCCTKIGVFKNSHDSRENTCVGVSFNKVAGLKLATLLKRDSNTDPFL